LALQGRYVMEGLGLDPEKDFEAIYTEQLVDGPAMILEGRASALWGAGNRWPGFVKIASDARGARFITPDDEQVTRIVDKYPFMRRISIPAARYPGQSDSLLTVGSWSYVWHAQISTRHWATIWRRRCTRPSAWATCSAWPKAPHRTH
jgi:TRAP-type uncharacterized transport system substrate-binding protein